VEGENLLATFLSGEGGILLLPFSVGKGESSCYLSQWGGKGESSCYLSQWGKGIFVHFFSACVQALQSRMGFVVASSNHSQTLPAGAFSPAIELFTIVVGGLGL